MRQARRHHAHRLACRRHGCLGPVLKIRFGPARNPNQINAFGDYRPVVKPCTKDCEAGLSRQSPNHTSVDSAG
jgi:hypothetical protein